VEVNGYFPKQVRKNDSECAESALTRSGKKEERIVFEELPDQTLVYDNNPESRLSSIEFLRIDESKLLVKLYQMQFHREYSTNIRERYLQTHFEARPGTAVFTQVFTLGLGAIFSPKMSALQALGCNDIQFSKRIANLENIKPTGLYLSYAFKKAPELLIAGFEGETSPIKLTASDWDLMANAWVVDLSDLVKKSRITGPSTLTVRCTTCEEVDESTRKRLQLVGPLGSVKADFTLLKARFDEIERKKQEDEALEAKRLKDAQEAEAKRIKDLEAAEAKRLEAQRKEAELQERLAKEKAAKEKQLQIQKQIEEEKKKRLNSL